MKLKKILFFSIVTFFNISLLFLSVMLYVRYLWSDLNYEQLRITLKDLTLDILKTNTNLSDIFKSLLFFILIGPLATFKLKPLKLFLLGLCCLLTGIYLTGAPQYIYLSRHTSTFYEEEYVTPTSLQVQFPEQKRNLILIYLESFEQNFSQADIYEKNLIPHLSAMQTSDNHSEKFLSINGTDYSIAALIAGHCGIPLRFKENRDIYEISYFLPQAICFPELLSQNGYQTKIIKAANIAYTQADLFTTSHGYQEALGIHELQNKYPELNQQQYLGTFGGLSDRTLFDYAKKELAEFKPDTPFMLTLFSLDTHMPVYHKDTNCQYTLGDVRDAFICTDDIVNDFINWLKTSPYWQNTTVIIIGDHLYANEFTLRKKQSLLSFFSKSNRLKTRSIYNLFLNLPEDKKILGQYKFSTMDLPPTILESLNIQISPRAFGFGRSLFAPEPTLSEKMNTKLDLKLIQKSKVYDKLCTPPARVEHYQPYTLNTLLKSEDMLAYTDAYQQILNSYYIDHLNLLLDKTPATDLDVKLKFNAIIEKGVLITISANNTEILTLAPYGTPQPYTAEFTIKKELIKQNKLKLTFRNHKGIYAATEIGIIPLSISVSEK